MTMVKILMVILAVAMMMNYVDIDITFCKRKHNPGNVYVA